MQRSEIERRHEARRKADQEAVQQNLVDQDQDHADEDGEETGQSSPASFLTARELQAWDPSSMDRRTKATDRRQSADLPRRVHKQPDDE